MDLYSNTTMLKRHKAKDSFSLFSKLVVTFILITVIQLNTYAIVPPANAVVKGTVSDKSGTLPGVNIKIKGTNKGTVTDFNGKYSISVSDENTTLIVSAIGYSTQEVALMNKTVLNIFMSEDERKLDEVVVIGYGVQKKATMTGSISSINTKDLLQSPQANISNALVGRMPGLIAVQRSGEPGNDASTLRIRGVGTFSGSQDPLVMIDGIQSDNYNNIDPNEIESVSILKDASATAVYGVRGANGVLLITTKRGVLGKPSISYSSNIAVSSFVDLPKRMDAYEWTTGLNLAKQYDSYITGNYTPTFTSEQIEKYRTGSDPIFYPNVDWFKTVLRPSSTVQQHNLSFSGGAKRAKYFISIGVYDQSGLFNTNAVKLDFDPQVKYTRYNFRSNFDFEISNRLKAIVNISSQIENRQGGNASTSTVYESLERANPIYTPGVLNGKVVDLGIASAVNPFVELLQGGFRKQYSNALKGSIRLNYDLGFITDGLAVHGLLSYQNYNNQTVINSKDLIVYILKKLPDGTIVYLPQKEEKPFGYSETVDKYRKTDGEIGIDYSKRVGVHNITAMILYNQSKLFNPNLAFLVPNAYQGVVGRVTYGYKDKYLVEFNAGYNGTENFAEGRRYGFFPAYSLGWVASEESFFPKNDAFSYLKLRATYGEVGNDKIGGDRFLYRPNSYSYTTNSYYFGEVANSYNPYTASNEGKIGNPYLTWERAKKTNLGADFAFWKDKIKLTVDYFDENRDNILANPQTIPAIYGATAPAYNLGRMRNSGFDGDISYFNKVGKLNYWLKVNFTYAHNIIQYQDEVQRPFSYQNSTGQSYGQPFGLVAEGLYNSWSEVNDPNRPISIYNNNKLQPGDIKYKDINGDGYITDDDRVPIGYSPFPEKVFGFSLGGNIKGFDFSVLFQGATNVSYNYTRRQQYGFFENSGAPQYLYYQSWTQERYNQGETINFPHLSVGNTSNQNNYAASTFWEADASYIRLKNAEVGYTVTNSFLNRLGINSARIYVNGSNLLTWSKMLPGVDPETEQASTNNETYPLTRVVNMGINIKF